MIIDNRKLNETKKKERKTIDNLKLTDWNTVRDCDVIITSSSRPELLKLTLDGMEKYIHFHGNFRFILNEDFVFPNESEKLVEWARKSGYFKEEDIIINRKPLGLEKALLNLMDRVKTPFCFHMQDDWVFERPIELDKVMYIMENIKEVNNILFYKARVPIVKDSVLMREYYFAQFPQFLTLDYSWELMPGVWRTSFAKPMIKEAMTIKVNRFRPTQKNKFRTAPAKITNYLRPKSKRDDMDYLYHNMGVFFWGAWGEPRWCRHIGENARMEAWRLSGGQPGSENQPQENSAVTNMAKWIPFEHIPKIKGRNSIKIMKEWMIKRGRKIQ